jgi:hypothetical protein
MNDCRLTMSAMTLMAAVFAFSTSANAANVYVTASGNVIEDSLVQDTLVANGNSVTVGDAWYQQNGTQSFAGYDVVLLLNNYNWSAGSMSTAGQQSFVDFVNAGGGVVTSEWMVWRIAASAPDYSALATIIPVVPSTAFNGAGLTTYSQNTANATINAGLPNSFTFDLGSISGTETQFQARPGASVFYSSSNGGGLANAGGLIGWDFGGNGGRVASFSTLIGQTELANANYALLLNNTINWAANSAPVPVPASVWLFMSALLPIARRWLNR